MGFLRRRENLADSLFSRLTPLCTVLGRTGWHAIFGLLGFALIHFQVIAAELIEPSIRRAETNYVAARSNYVAAPREADSAHKFARACFDFADLVTSDQKRASVAEEGIAAARVCIEVAPAKAEGHLYLALNMGELARTRMWSALWLLRHMEKSFLQAIELDPYLNYAGADRSLGMLYREAPGWPASIGNKKKAREHLERAVALASDYPDNHLSLLEGYVMWGDTSALAAGVERYRQMLVQAKSKYTGEDWEQAWRDWELRWNSVLQHCPGVM